MDTLMHVEDNKMEKEKEQIIKIQKKILEHIPEENKNLWRSWL
jgi:hypothetical protein